MAIIPERNHATSNCGCNELSLGNNLEGRVFTVICLPREFVKPATIPEPYGDSLDALNNASLRYTNSSLVYIGELSEINTTIPHLARRAPLGKLEREPVVDYRPYGGEIDYAEHPEILRGVLAQARRPEMEAYWLSLPISDEHDGNNAEDWPRFHSKGRFTNTDLYYNYRYNGKLYYIMGVAFYFRMNYEVLNSISTILKSG